MDQSEIIHRQSLRLKDSDYSQTGAYFVTICTNNRQWLFGEIRQGEMVLSAIGRLVSAQWQQIPYRFAGLELGAWIVMPNHIHGILIITRSGEASNLITPVLQETADRKTLPTQPRGTAPGSVGAIIQNYKSITSRKISRQNESMRAAIWQRNYYEHIIRNEREFRAISEYIIANPHNWEHDMENKV